VLEVKQEVKVVESKNLVAAIFLPLAPPGPSFFALFWSVLSYFVPNGLPVGPGDPDENGFSSGGIAPHLGEIWGLAGVHFGPLFLEILTCDFGNFKLIDSTYSLLSILKF